MNKNYIVYNTNDGDIRVNIQCGSDDIQMQCGLNEAWMEHDPVDDSTYKVDLTTLTVVQITE